MIQITSDDICRLVSVEFSDFDIGINENNVDWRAVNERIRQTLWAVGLVPDDLFEFLGIDVDADDYLEVVRNLPKVKTTLNVANYLGVSASWLITGRGQPPTGVEKHARGVTMQEVSNTSGSTVIQGNHAETMIINGATQTTSAQKKELDRIWNTLSVRNQTQLLSVAYRLEDGEAV